jgi:prephenate dehydrogenase
MRIAFLGLGLIGGSVALASARAGFATSVTAWTPTGRGPREGSARGIEAATSPADAIRGADLIVLAAPPLACLALLDQLGGPLRGELASDAVVTDVASTKAIVVERARSFGLRFVGGHPMAGRETSGFGAADPELLRNRPWVIVPAEPADAEADARVEAVAEACGAQVLRMEAEAHDRAVASISHAPLVLAAALAESVRARPDRDTALGLAAGGWAGMTRLALGEPAMGAGILSTNRTATTEALLEVRAAIDRWVEALAASDPDELERRLQSVRDDLAAQRPTEPVAGEGS